MTDNYKIDHSTRHEYFKESLIIGHKLEEPSLSLAMVMTKYSKACCEKNKHLFHWTEKKVFNTGNKGNRKTCLQSPYHSERYKGYELSIDAFNDPWFHNQQWMGPYYFLRKFNSFPIYFPGYYKIIQRLLKLKQEKGRVKRTRINYTCHRNT